MPRITAPHLKDLNRSARLGLAPAKAAPANRRRPKNAPESKPAAVSEGTPEHPVLQFAADELAGQLGWRNDWAGAPYSWESMVAAVAFLWKMADSDVRRSARLIANESSGQPCPEAERTGPSGTPVAQEQNVDVSDLVVPPPQAGGVSWTHADRAHQARGAVIISFAVEREADGGILVEIPELKCSGSYSLTLAESLASAFELARPTLLKELNGALNATLHLQVGKTYRDRGGAHWICYLVDAQALRSRQAACIRVGQHFTRYFFIDGRHDPDGSDEFALVAEVP